MYALKLFGMVVFKKIPITFLILTKIFLKCSIRYIEIVKQILCTKKKKKNNRSKLHYPIQYCLYYQSPILIPEPRPKARAMKFIIFEEALYFIITIYLINHINPRELMKVGSTIEKGYHEKGLIQPLIMESSFCFLCTRIHIIILFLILLILIEKPTILKYSTFKLPYTQISHLQHKLVSFTQFFF